MAQDRERCAEAGMNFFIVKVRFPFLSFVLMCPHVCVQPFVLKDLLRVLDRVFSSCSYRFSCTKSGTRRCTKYVCSCSAFRLDLKVAVLPFVGVRRPGIAPQCARHSTESGTAWSAAALLKLH